MLKKEEKEKLLKWIESKTVFDCLNEIKNDLSVSQNYNLTKEQKENFNFIEERLIDGEKAEDILLQIDSLCAKSKGLI